MKGTKNHGKNKLGVDYLEFPAKCTGPIPIKIGTLQEDIISITQKNIFLESHFFHIYMQLFSTDSL